MDILNSRNTDSFVKSGTAWKNTEWRTYRFPEDTENEPAMVETEESRKQRGWTGPALNREQQEQLQKQALKTWVKIGALRPE
jgi:hypothetical protein